MTAQAVRIGCSGWSYDDWRGGLYPEGLPQRRWLERYAEVFDTVEVNATFYRLPKESTVEGWVEQVPGDFLFAIKSSRYLTHMKRLREITDSVARFWEPLEPLRRRRRLGPVLWQLPENFHRDDDLLASALTELPPADHCFEFRHPSWFAGPVRDLLAEHGASLAIGDDKRRPLPEAKPAGKIAYLRLHYGHRGRDGNYSEAELDGWRRRIAAWRSRRPVFVYLNNDWKGYAPTNARYLKRGLSQGGSG
jgi:uncharacterized protein YecE (DUF72 family)